MLGCRQTLVADPAAQLRNYRERDMATIQYHHLPTDISSVVRLFYNAWSRIGCDISLGRPFGFHFGGVPSISHASACQHIKKVSKRSTLGRDTFFDAPLSILDTSIHLLLAHFPLPLIIFCSHLILPLAAFLPGAGSELNSLCKSTTIRIGRLPG